MSIETRRKTECPRCGASAKTVKRVTLESLLSDSANERLTDTRYRYCGNETCPVVYLGEDGSVFEKSDLTVRVGVKEASAPRPVCYCFDHSIEEIESEVAATGKSTVLDDIKLRMKEACWCETKSPQGTCCLGTVSRYEKAALARYGQEPVATMASDCHTQSTGSGSRDTRNQPGVRAGRVALVGSVVSAVVASACCWLPLLLVAFGVSGAAFLATFENYRPFFLTLTFGLLAVAFYLGYRPKKIADASCCPSPTSTLQRVNLALLWVVTAVALAFAFFPNYSGVLTGRAETSVEGLESLPAVTLSVSGMHCVGCAPSVREALEAVPGVVGASVDYESGNATVRVDEKRPPSRAALAAAVERLGYTARPTNEKAFLK